MKYIYKNPVSNRLGGIDCLIILGGGWVPTTQDLEFNYTLSDSIGPDDWSELAPYIAPVKTIGQLQDEAVSVMASAIREECRSGTGKLYFSNIESAAMYTSVIQEDAEIRARAEELMLWSFAIDTYALSIVFDIDEGGDIPTIEEFIAGMPTI